MPKINPENYNAYVAPQDTLKSLIEGTEGLSKSEWCGKVLSNLKHATLPVLNRIGYAIKSKFAEGSWMSNKQIATDILNRINKLNNKVDGMEPNGLNLARLKDLAYEISLLEVVCQKLGQHGAKNTEDIGEQFSKIKTKIVTKIGEMEVEDSVVSKEVSRGLIPPEDIDKLLEMAKKKKLSTYNKMYESEKLRRSDYSPSIAKLEGTWDIEFLKDFKIGLEKAGAFVKDDDGKLVVMRGFNKIVYLYMKAANRHKNIISPDSTPSAATTSTAEKTPTAKGNNLAEHLRNKRPHDKGNNLAEHLRNKRPHDKGNDLAEYLRNKRPHDRKNIDTDT